MKIKKMHIKQQPTIVKLHGEEIERVKCFGCLISMLEADEREEIERVKCFGCLISMLEADEREERKQRQETN